MRRILLTPLCVCVKFSISQLKGHLLACLDIHGQEPRLVWLAVVVDVADKLGPGSRDCALTGHRARGEAVSLGGDSYIICRSLNFHNIYII